MKLQCLFLFLCYMCATVVDSRKKGGGYKEAILSCNAYIDSMIQEVLQDIKYLDPYQISESLITFHKKVVFIDFKGEAKLTDGYISGLRNLHRSSSCSLTFEEGRYKVSAKLEVDEISFNATGFAKALKMKKNISTEGYTTKVFMNTAISLNGNGKDSVLENLNVDYIREIHVGPIVGIKFLGWMEDPIVMSVGHFFQALVEKLVEVQLKTFFAERVKEEPFSLEDFDLDIDDLEVTTPEDTTHIGKPVYTKEDADSYIDSVLQNRFQLEAQYSQLNFHFLEDHLIEKVHISNEKDNYMELKNGYLDNLTKIKRIQDCSQPIMKSSNVTFTCFLGYDRLKFLYTAESHNGNSVSNFELVVLVDDTRLGVKITTTVEENLPNMLDLTVHNLGKIKVMASHVVADAPTMQAESTFDKNVLIKHFSELLRRIFLGKLKEVLGYSIHKTPIHFVY